jgi:hypothetical protein
MAMIKHKRTFQSIMPGCAYSAKYTGSKLSVASLWMRHRRRSAARLQKLLEAKETFQAPQGEAYEALTQYQLSVADAHARSEHWKLMRGFSSPGRVIFLRPRPLFSNMRCDKAAISDCG